MSEPVGLTMAHLLEAIRKVEELPPTLAEIRVAGLAETLELLYLLGATATEVGSVGGVKIMECPYMPKQVGVMVDSRGNVMGIFDIGKQVSEGV